MRGVRWLAMLWLLGLSPSMAANPGPVRRELPISDVVMAGLSEASRDPDAYAELVRQQTRAFPEGRLFPYVMPTLAWLNVASAEPSRRGEALAAVGPLMPHLLAELSDIVSPGEALLDLEDTRGHGTWIGQTALALGAYRQLGGTGHADEHDHLVALLAAAFDARAGGPIDSYPNLIWAFDSVPAALALRLHDVQHRSDAHEHRISQHLAWIGEQGRDPDSGLPASVLTVDDDGWHPIEGPRGCELALRIGLLAQLDRAAAREQYRAFARAMWRPGPVIGGFAEWPRGQGGTMDFDSGPVVFGRGAVSSGFGLGAARAVGDRRRHDVLAAEVATVAALMPLVVEAADGAGGLPGLGSTELDSRWTTGFLFGDAALAWAVTWSDWGVAGG